EKAYRAPAGPACGSETVTGSRGGRRRRVNGFRTAQQRIAVDLERPARAIREEQLQGGGDRSEREFVPGDLLFIEEASLQAFGPGFELGVGEPGQVENVDLVDVGDVQYGEQGPHFDAGAGFFLGFARGALGRGFPELHEPGREGPIAVAGFDRAAAE